MVASRSLVIHRAKQRLLAESYPRLQMMLLVALTGGFGLLASFLLLQAGVQSMALRYPLALAVAYLFFLFLLWLWLRTKASDFLDIPSPSGTSLDARSANNLPMFKSGGGGDFGGGGASGSFDSAASASADVVSAPVKAVGKTIGVAAEADEFAIPLIAIILALVLAVGIVLASFYVVYIAPVLFAELLVDGALSYALFRHLRKHEQQHWLRGALRHTIVPFVATAVFLMIIGAAMSAYAPGASSIGQVLTYRATSTLSER